jgi:predicted metalloprotease
MLIRLILFEIDVEWCSTLTFADRIAEAALWQNSVQLALTVENAVCGPDYCHQKQSQYHDLELHFFC